jgi:hypothetical protein
MQKVIGSKRNDTFKVMKERVTMACVKNGEATGVAKLQTLC